MAIGLGYPNRCLTPEEIEQLASQALSKEDLDGKKVLIIIPDRTRTAPIPQFFRLFHKLLTPRVAKLDFLVALGTHPPLDDDSMNQLVGISAEERRTTFRDVGLHNHLWGDPSTFAEIGTIGRGELEGIVAEAVQGLTEDVGLLRDLPVKINRLVLDYDQLMICGPTFPHEVVGFSGGAKYFFPGIGGSEVINYSHWLGAVLSSFHVIGTKFTPVRKVIERAAAFIDKPCLCFSMVVSGHDLAGLYIGSTSEAYSAAADLSAQVHIKWLDEPVKRVLSVMPVMYDDIWTAAKGMYKMEPVVADGGEVVIYAPHIDEISYTHGKILDEVGYHVIEYFLKQWDRFKNYPGGVLAHSTHVRGLGTFDAEARVERPRINVTLATRIPKERCERVGLGYLDPDSVKPADWESQGAGHLLVPKAGEMLYRLK